MASPNPGTQPGIPAGLSLAVGQSHNETKLVAFARLRYCLRLVVLGVLLLLDCSKSGVASGPCAGRSSAKGLFPHRLDWCAPGNAFGDSSLPPEEFDKQRLPSPPR